MPKKSNLSNLKREGTPSSLSNMDNTCKACVNWFMGKSKKRCLKHNPKEDKND